MKLQMIFMIIFALFSTVLFGNGLPCKDRPPKLALFAEDHQISNKWQLINPYLGNSSDPLKPIIFLEAGVPPSYKKYSNLKNLEDVPLKVVHAVIQLLLYMDELDEKFRGGKIIASEIVKKDGYKQYPVLVNFLHLILNIIAPFKGIKDDSAQKFVNLAGSYHLRIMKGQSSFAEASNGLAFFLIQYSHDWKKIHNELEIHFKRMLNTFVDQAVNQKLVTMEQASSFLKNKLNEQDGKVAKQYRDDAINEKVGEAILDYLIPENKSKCRDVFVISGQLHQMHIMNYLAANFLEEIGREDFQLLTLASVHRHLLTKDHKLVFARSEATKNLLEAKAFYHQGKLQKAKEKVDLSISIVPSLLGYQLAVLIHLEMGQEKMAKAYLKKACDHNFESLVLQIYSWYLNDKRDPDTLLDLALKLKLNDVDEIGPLLEWNSKFQQMFHKIAY